jgi:hypothetical protein
MTLGSVDNSAYPDEDRSELTKGEEVRCEIIKTSEDSAKVLNFIEETLALVAFL